MANPAASPKTRANKKAATSTEKATASIETPAYPSDVNNTDEAREHLQKAGYLDDGEEFQLDQISSVLFRASRTIPKTQKLLTNLIRALAFLCRGIDIETTAAAITAAVMHKLQNPSNR